MKKKIEDLSIKIFNYLIKKKIHGKEWILGYSLITFIQHTLIIKSLYNFNDKKIKHISLIKKLKIENLHYHLRSIEFNRYLISELYYYKNQNLKKKNGSINFSKEEYLIKTNQLYFLIKFIFFNIKKNISLNSLNLIKKKIKKSSLSNLDLENKEKEFANFLYYLFDKTFSYKLNYPAFLNYLPLRFYSGIFCNIRIVNHLMQSRYDNKKEIISFQHGGHNYVSSKYNFFLFPEYGLSNKIVLGGSLKPIIKNNYITNHIYISSFKKKLINQKKPFNENRIIFVAMKIEKFTLRIDGNPCKQDFNFLINKTEKLLNELKGKNLFLKEYPNQNYWIEKINFRGNSYMLKKEYELGSIFICDHFGTTFLKALYKNNLCVLIIDKQKFNIREDVYNLIKSFVFTENNFQLWFDKMIQKWKNGKLEKSRIKILKSLYNNERIF